jgi:hypothetical protein
MHLPKFFFYKTRRIREEKGLSFLKHVSITSATYCIYVSNPNIFYLSNSSPLCEVMHVLLKYLELVYNAHNHHHPEKVPEKLRIVQIFKKLRFL